jgi:hypothetical protein
VNLGGACKTAVSLKPGSSATEDEPIAPCREQPVSSQYLCSVDVVDTLPRNLASPIM